MPILIGSVWLLLAILGGWLGFLRLLPAPFPQFVLVGLLALLLLAIFAMPACRKWSVSLPIDAILTLHLSRFVGFYFLYLHARGQLPYDFAVPGGWGDIVVASGALLLIALSRIGLRIGSLAYLVWNVLGLVDIVFVVLTAGRLAIADSESMTALLDLPLSLLPTFLVPLIVASHVLLFVQLSIRRPRQAEGSSIIP